MLTKLNKSITNVSFYEKMFNILLILYILALANLILISILEYRAVDKRLQLTIKLCKLLKQNCDSKRKTIQ